MKIFLALLPIALLMACQSSTAPAGSSAVGTSSSSTNENQTNIQAPFLLDDQFISSRRTGDATKRGLEVNQICKNPRTSPECNQIVYTPQSDRWAEVSWNPRGAGINEKIVQGATKVQFWAAGENGGEVVSFAVGEGANLVQLQNVQLTKNWQLYSINLPTGNLATRNGFNFRIDANSNPSGATFYIDGVTYHTAQTVNSSLQQSNSSLCESSPQYNQGQVPADGDNSYKLVWSDEFHCLDLNRWNIDYGNNNGWGNGEKQYYTDRNENLFVHNNVLYIRGARKDFRGSEYTSARLNSRYKGDFKYGKVEVRFRNPRGNGKWPAIWMMPTEEKHGIWPRSGEIDIMEASGDKHNKIFSTVHWHTGTGGALHSRTFPFNNIDFTAGFNVITLNWESDNTGKARFNVTYEGPGNRATYYTFLAEKPNAPPFHDKFYLIVNLALGGRIPETTIHTIDDAALNHELAIDYIRVYQKR